MSDPANSFDDFTLEELEAAIAAKRGAHLAKLRSERERLAAELRAVEARLAQLEGRALPPIAEDAGESETTRPARRRPLASLVLKALAASHPAQITRERLVDELKASGPSERLQVQIAQLLGRMQKNGLVQAWEDGSCSLTPEGLRRAGAG